MPKYELVLHNNFFPFFLNLFLFFFVKGKIISLFFLNYERLWQIIIVNIPKCNWTAESAK